MLICNLIGWLIKILIRVVINDGNIGEWFEILVSGKLFWVNLFLKNGVKNFDGNNCL